VTPPVATFLTSYNLEGKTIVPFITHEGSSLGKAVADIETFCPRSNVLDGMAIRGGSVNDAEQKVVNWIKSLKLSN